MSGKRARLVSPERVARDFEALRARGVPVCAVRREPGGGVVYLTEAGPVASPEPGESAPDWKPPRTPDAP